MTVAEQNAAAWRGELEPWSPAMWWTLLVLAVLCGCTVVGLVVTIPVGLALYARSPYRHQQSAEVDSGPPTEPIPRLYR